MSLPLAFRNKEYNSELKLFTDLGLKFKIKKKGFSKTSVLTFFYFEKKFVNFNFLGSIACEKRKAKV